MGDKMLLSVAEMDTYDPTGVGNPRRLCPACGDEKPKDAAHRSVSVDYTTGLYRCFRCGLKGKLRDFWQERPLTTRRERQRVALSRAFDVPLSQPNIGDSPSQEWRALLHDLQMLADTPGARYLEGRAIPLDIARASRGRFAPSWYGRPAVVFPVRDQNGALVAVQGRYTDGRANPKARTVGEKRSGVFLTPGVFASDAPIIVTEAPIDALSLAVAGYPALALCGTSAPGWLPAACRFQRVLLAFDADDAGDKAADDILPLLRGFGARAKRLRPDGAKDWNEMLQNVGAFALADWLAFHVLPED